MSDNPNSISATASVVAVQDGIVTLEAIKSGRDENPALIKNEIVYICLQVGEGARPERLKAEVLHCR